MRNDWRDPFLWLSALVLISSPRPASAAPGASYIESSTGLASPALEAGRTEVEMADVNADGHIDLISAGDHGNPGIGGGEFGIMVWFGDGRGGWSSFQFGELGYGGIAVGDVDGDGLADIGYGIHHNYSSTDLGDQILEVALGDGTGRSWTPWDDGLANNGESWGMFGSDFADVDGDGRLDLGSISFGCCAGAHVYLNHGDGSWAQSFGFLDGNSDMEFVFGDVNNDGWPDFALSHDAGTVYLGDGRGSFTLGDTNLPPKSTFGRSGVALGDVNGDGRDDLAWINSGGGPEVFVSGADGSWSDFGGALPATGPWEAAQLWDMDGDGIVDLAAFGSGKVTVWKGNGSGSWTSLSSITIPTPGYYQAFRVGGDADHNGYPDIALVSEEGAPFHYQNHLRSFKETTAAASLRARIVRPGPGARLRTGTVRFIDWAAEVPTGAPGSARIEYSASGITGPWRLIADGVPNSGRRQWTVPDVPGTDDLRLRVTVTASGSTATSERALMLSPGHDFLRLTFVDASTLSWSDRLARSIFNLYRGDWDRLRSSGEYTQDPAHVPRAARWCRIEATTWTDATAPDAARMVFYLVAGISGEVEGSLGTRSDQAERANANPCP
jgi:hypothetical protein